MEEVSETMNEKPDHSDFLSDDDIPRLSEHALAALAEFYAEQNVETKERVVEEDWQLSQFWYTEETAEKLAAECIAAAENGESIACLSCPTLMEFLSKHEDVNAKKLSLFLLEFDSRFAVKYPSAFAVYDYRKPLNLPERCRNTFDLIIIDPPFLSDECFVKIAQTVRLLSRTSSAKILICTGVVMQTLVERLFNAHRCTFTPKHRRNLANEFACFANYTTSLL